MLRNDTLPHPVRLTSVRASGFADGRHEVSPDSERNETTKPQAFCRVSVSVEQIQDRGKHKFASTLFPQTENAPVLDIQKLIKTFYKSAFG